MFVVVPNKALASLYSAKAIQILGNIPWEPYLACIFFSKCDSTSACYAIDKRKWLNIVKDKEENNNALGILGESLQIEDHLFDMIGSMVCQPYGFLKRPNVNDVWYKCCGETFPEYSKIPPTKNKSTC